MDSRFSETLFIHFLAAASTIIRPFGFWFAFGIATTFFGVPPPDDSPTHEVRIDSNAVSHRFYGFGTQIWASEIGKPIQNLLLDLDLDYVRVAATPNWNLLPATAPVNSSAEEMDAYIEASFMIYNPILLARSKLAFDFCKQHSIQTVLIIFSPPKTWQPIKNHLLPEYLDDFARLWGSTLHILEAHGMRPDFIEISNEPEGEWNSYIPPDKYNDLLKQVRDELDRRGLKDIGIVGPGVNAQIGDKWINALDNAGLTALGAWSAHNYELQITSAEETFTPFLSAAKKRDISKPILVTEYSTKKTNFAGVQLADNEGNATEGATKASFSMPYAVQVYQNTISLINKGANAVFYWEAGDYSWSTKQWGLIDRQGSPKPVYKVLSTLYPKIPDNASVLKRSWNDPDLTVAAFKTDNAFIIAVANITGKKVVRDFSVLWAGKPKTIEINPSEAGAVTTKTLPEISQQYRFQATIDKQSSATLVLHY